MAPSTLSPSSSSCSSLPHDPQADLELAQGGDRQALERLFSTHVNLVEGWVRRRLGGRMRELECVADLTQDVLLAAYRNFSHFEDRGTGSFRRWLARITTNVVRGRARYWNSDKRDARRELSISDLAPQQESEFELHDPRPGPEQTWTASWERHQVERCLHGLPATARRVVELREYQGLSWGQVAQALGAPSANAAQMRYLRAVDRLSGPLKLALGCA